MERKLMKVEVLGGGCQKCHQLTEQTAAVLEELGIEADLEHVSDLKRISRYGVLSTPALVIDGKVKCVGRIPSIDEMKGWLLS
jgi:small redox-active disulfide protein 2